MAEWAGLICEERASIAWLSLDRRDNDPVLFWTYVVTAMGTAAPGLGEATLRSLSSPAPLIEAALAGLLNEVEALSTRLVVVLDDYHVIESPDVHEGIRYILEHQPPHLHLIIATRVDPPLPLAQLRARGRLVEFRAGDLRFTAERRPPISTARWSLG